MREKLNEDNSIDLRVISTALKMANKSGLEAEVVWSALRFSSGNKDWPMEDVMSAALEDWDI
jgi:hypothetical protein|tara:strand:+ start:2594 stop:2779 length:186 start_codon:yes stop_codon:yes gene_type:complete